MPEGQYRFGNCELGAANRKLLVDGHVVDLQPRAFDLLLYLVEHAGRLVTKDELLDNVWGQRFVTESVIARMVMKVRKAIGDDAGDPRYILTQYGTGYRFVGEVERVADPLPRAMTGQGADGLPDAAVAAEIALPAGVASAGRLAGRRYWLLAVVAVAVVAVILAVVLLPRTSQPAGLPRVAVLPITNATGDAGLGWTELGLMSSIGDAMQARMPVDMIPAAEVLSMLRAVPGDELTGERLEAVRSRLKADALVLGRLQRAGKVLDLEVELFRDGRRSSIAALNDKEPAALAGPAGQAVVETLAPVAHRSAAGAGNPLSADAYVNEAYGRALDAMARSKYDAAAELLKVVVREVGDQPAPRNRLAVSLNYIGKHKEALEQASTAMKAAQGPGNESQLARAYKAAGNACIRLGDFDCAERYGNRILKLATPEDPTIELGAYSLLGIAAAERGQTAEARRLMEASIVAYQGMKSAYQLASAHFNLGVLLDQLETNDVSGARHNLQLALEYGRTSGRFNLQIDALDRLANIERKEGQCLKAFEYLDVADTIQRANDVPVTSRINLQIRALCLDDLGRSREALAVVDEMEKLDSSLQRPAVAATNKMIRAAILRGIPAHSQADVWSLYQQAVATFGELEMQIKRKEALGEQATYAIAHGRNKEAAALLAQAQKLVDGGDAGDDIVILDARAMAAYYNRDRQQALDLLNKAATAGNHRDTWWRARMARMAWVELELGAVDAAAGHFGTVASHEGGHVGICLVGARLSYERGQYREAADKQAACVKQLGDRVSPADYAWLDAYTAAATGAKRLPLPKVSPQALWL